MKLSELQLNEAMDEYDTILHNLLKIVANFEKMKQFPFGTRSWKFQGKDMGDIPAETISSILGKLGSKSGLNSTTTRAEGYREMTNAVQDFIERLTPGRWNKKPGISKKEIAGIARAIYIWSQNAAKLHETFSDSRLRNFPSGDPHRKVSGTTTPKKDDKPKLSGKEFDKLVDLVIKRAQKMKTLARVVNQGSTALDMFMLDVAKEVKEVPYNIRKEVARKAADRIPI